MKVEILRQQRNKLHYELDYDLFLSLFAQDQPLLSSVILRPMDKEKAIDHYAQLAKIEQQIGPENRDTILRQGATLPALEQILSLFKKEIESYRRGNLPPKIFFPHHTQPP